MQNNYLEELTGEFTHVIYSSDNYMVAKFKSEDGPLTVTGPFFEYEKGLKYELTGEYVEHPKYGFQFNYIKIEKHLGSNHDEIVSFLSSKIFKGVGKIAAERIYQTFKEDTLRILKDKPDAIYEVNITAKQAIAIIAGFETLNDPKNDIMFYLVSNGFNTLEAQRIFNTFDLVTKEVANTNPFRFYNEIFGISFDKVKKFASLIDFDDKQRKYKESFLIYLLTELLFQTGNTFSLLDDFSIYCQKYFVNESIEEYLQMCVDDKYMIIEDRKVYLFNDYYDEIYIASFLNTFKNALILDDDLFFEGIDNNQNTLSIKYDDRQIDAIKSFFKNGISIVVGGPGTGKTTIVKTMVNMFKAYFPFNNLICIAPTGRAAKRINEICDCDAKTIHSLLRWNKETNTFAYDIDNPILYDAIIIDEFSMVDSNLFACLLKACRNVKKICIIGDDNQLPSIRPGYVLNDLISSEKFVVTHLFANYRQKKGNEIIKLCSDIINEDVDLQRYNTDIFFYDIKKSHVDLISMISKNTEEGFSLNDIQVLAPMYRGVFGIDNLNITIQEAFNPYDGSIQKNIGKYNIRINDKILQLKNRPTDDVYNGDIGICSEIDLVEKNVTVNYANTFVFYPFEELNELALAYALSVHKAQGSEYQIVYFCFSKENIHMLNRKLIYTAVSRAKERLILIGDKATFMEGLSRMMKPRQTSLVQRLNNSII